MYKPWQQIRALRRSMDLSGKYLVCNTHDVGVGGSRNQNPRIIFLQGLNFIIHSSKLSRILHSRFKSLWLNRCKKSINKSRGTHNAKMCRMLCLENASFSSCEHRMRTQWSDCNGIVRNCG